MTINKKTNAYHGIGLHIKFDSPKFTGTYYHDDIIVIADNMAALKRVFNKLSYTGELDEKRTRRVKVRDDATTRKI